MHTGTIYKAMSGFYYVKSKDAIYTCTARGRFRHANCTPLVGDIVGFDATGEGTGILTSVEPRKNEFARPPLANIDKIIIVASKAIPVSDPFLIDKMTAIALSRNADPVICINKLDLSEADDLYSIYATTGFPVVKTSAVTGDGIDRLVAEIKGFVCAFCGNSGVGKSSILNAIDPSFGIATGDVSLKLGRGRHTTRHVELFDLFEDTPVADTPGFSVFDTGHIADKNELQHLFPEFEPYIGKCRFDDCSHLNEPGCAILEAVSAGVVHPVRHESYVRLYKQAAEHKAWEN